MGLYLTIFEHDVELDGVEIGTYSDFSLFRNTVAQELEANRAGSRFPTLMFHPDCDGQWTSLDATVLEQELSVISFEFRGLPPVGLGADWKMEVAKLFGIKITSLYDCFFDVDGEPLIERLINLSRLSQAKSLSILFQ